MTEAEKKIVEKARKILRSYANKNSVITSWQQLLDYTEVHFSDLSVEHFHVLYLDRKNRLIEDVRTGSGTVDHVPVYPREVVKMALQLDASAMILVHNHPSGDPSPSKADIDMTKQIVNAADALGITVHDHIIVGRGDHHSMRASGEM